jgi:hypothetical protein
MSKATLLDYLVDAIDRATIAGHYREADRVMLHALALQHALKALETNIIDHDKKDT